MKAKVKQQTMVAIDENLRRAIQISGCFVALPAEQQEPMCIIKQTRNDVVTYLTCSAADAMYRDQWHADREKAATYCKDFADYVCGFYNAAIRAEGIGFNTWSFDAVPAIPYLYQYKLF